MDDRTTPVARVRPRFKPDPPYRVTFMRAYRKKAHKTLEQVAEFVGKTHATLGRIERGLQPYSQPILEAYAEYLGTDTASLLMRDPNDPHGIWSIWDKAKPAERKMIVDIARTVLGDLRKVS